MVHLRMQCAKGSKGELVVRACRRPAMSRTKNRASRQEKPRGGSRCCPNGEARSTGCITN